jgi:serine/threonine protein kinase
MLYEMLTGRTPFDEDTPMGMIRVHIAGEALPPPGALRDDLPSLAERVLIKALMRTPEERFANCVTFAEAFQEATTGVLKTKTFSFSLPPVPEPAEKDTVKLDAPPESKASDRRSNFVYHLILIGVVALMVIMGVMSSIFIRGMRLIWSVEQSLTEQAVVTQTAEVESDITVEP